MLMIFLGKQNRARMLPAYGTGIVVERWGCSNSKCSARSTGGEQSLKPKYNEFVNGGFSFQWHRSVAERKKVRLEKIKKEIRIWQRRNACSEITIDQSSIRRDEFITELRDPLRLNVAAFRTRKIRAIRKRARLARQIRDNFERLSILKNILEISKLRTYPTLKFKL